jgi:hypothetical protein
VRVSRVPLDEAIHRVRVRLASGAGAVHDAPLPDADVRIDEVE